MTNEEIDAIIERQESSLRRSAVFAPAVLWLGNFIFTAFAFFAFLISLGAFYSLRFSGRESSFDIRGDKRKQKVQEDKAHLIWEKISVNHTFGEALSLSTRCLGTEIQNIYDGDPSGKIFPLRQSIRLIDTHNRQQQRLQIVENRLRELRALQESLSEKMEQLQKLGEDYPQGARNLEQINGDLAALSKVHGQIHGSCTRLEAIVIGVQKAAQARRLRSELDGLSARITRSDGAIEPAFEAESLEEIERQIGREIETYLQLERETDEHLR